MKKPMIALLGAAVCCTQIVSAEVKTTDNTSVDLYVQNGLIGHWDAVDNGGRGIHNTSASTWVNLAPADKEGRIDDIILHTAAIELRDNAIFKKGTNNKTGLFGYLLSQPGNVATIETAVSGITNAVSDYTNGKDMAQFHRCLLSLVTITKYQQVFLAPDIIQRSHTNIVPPEHHNDYALYFDDGADQTPPRPSPTLSDRLDALTVSATYIHQEGDEPCKFDAAYANGAVLAPLPDYCKTWNLAGQNENVTTFGGRAGSGSIVDSVKNENKTCNYSMHSIRFYDRKLEPYEVQWNAFVDHYRFEGAVSGVKVVTNGENAYTVTGTFIPLDFAGDMTVKITELNVVDESETVQKFTIKPGEGGARSFSFTGRPPRCLVTVTVSQTYVSQAYGGMTLEKSISGLKTWEEGGTAGNNSWIGEWTDPVTSWYAAPEKWSAGRFPIADDTLTIGNEENKSYAVRLGVPVSVSAGTLNIASMVGQSNRLEIANGAELSLGNGELCVVKGGENDKMYGELILSNGTLKVGTLTGGYSKSANHLGRIVVDGNSQLLVSGDAWIGIYNGAPYGGYSHVAMLVRGGSVEVTGNGTPASTGNTGFFYGSSVPLTIEGGKITASKLAFISTINMSGGEIATPFGLIFNNSGDGARMNQSGGRFSGMIGVDRVAGYYTISGGEFDCETFASGARNSDANRALTFRTVGSKPEVSIANFENMRTTAWFVFWDYALGADGRVSAHENAATNVFGYYHVAPLGGVQLIHTNCVTLVHNAEKDLVEDTTQWSGNGIKTLSGDMWDYGISADKRRMEATLKTDSGFKLTNGELLATPVDRGYLEITGLPPEGSKGLKSLTVRLALVPKGETTLDDIIARINESGAGTARAIDGGADWNVLVEIPVTSVEKATGERVALDFTEYNTFKQDKNAKTMVAPTATVRAKIKGARVTVLHQGLILIVK